MYVTEVPNHGSRPTILLRESYRVEGKTKNRTLANLTHWAPERVTALKAGLRGDRVGGELRESFEIVRSLPHGHVAAVLGTLRRLSLEKLLAPKRSRARDLCAALIAARILDPRSKLATAGKLAAATAANSLGEAFEVETVKADELYKAMDWLRSIQPAVESKLAKRHLSEGSLVLYDLTSSYLEGRKCPLAKIGHSRDGKKGKLQVVIGLVTSGDGCPVSVEVFEGNTSDSMTVAGQVEKVRERFGIKRLVLVGDRGTITDARIEKDLRPIDGVDWITALRSHSIQRLVKQGELQLSLFDEVKLAEIESTSFPGERLIACKNVALALERARKREDLLRETELELEKIAVATRREKRKLRGKGAIGLRAGAVLRRFKVGKHFKLTIREDGFSYARKVEAIEREASIDGIYVIRTSVKKERLPAEGAVRDYKRLAEVEQAFRSLKTVDLRVRPIHHRKAERVRAHVFLCMLAYYVEWHMRRDLAPILFDDDDRAVAESARESVVDAAQRSPRALAKARTKRTQDGYPVQSFQNLLQDLATVVKNRVQPKDGSDAFDIITVPTPLQQKAYELLEVSYRRP
jgi:transposase